MCVTPEWCWETPLPQGYDLVAVHGTAADDVWAVGAHGTALWFGGTAWTRQSIGTTSNLHGVWAAAKDDAWLVGDDGVLIHWNGKGYVPFKVTSLDLQSVWGTASDDVWVVGNVHGIPQNSTASALHWDGRTWTRSDLPTLWITALWGRARDDYWAAGGQLCTDNLCFPSSSMTLHYDGNRWTPAMAAAGATNSFLRASDGEGYWISGGDGDGVTLRHLVGSTWVNLYTNPAMSSLAPAGLWGPSGSDLWSADPLGAKILHWDGARLTSAPTPLEGQSFWGSADGDAWEVGANGGIAHGPPWSAISTGEHGTTPWALLSGSGADDVWYLNGALLHFDGSSWTKSSVSASTWNGLYAKDKNNAWVTDSNGSVAHWDGSQWTKLPPSPARLQQRIWASSPSDVWLTVSGAEYDHFDGASWKHLYTCQYGGTARALWGSSATDLWGAADHVGLFHVTGGAAQPTCSVDANVTGVLAIWGRSASDIWAVGAAGAAYHYDGTSWTEHPAGVSHDLNSVWAAGPNDVWATGLIPGKLDTDMILLHWDGAQWSRVDAVRGMSAVWGSDATHVWAGGRGIMRFQPQ